MDMIMTYTEASLGLNLIMNCLKEKGIVLNKKDKLFPKKVSDTYVL